LWTDFIRKIQRIQRISTEWHLSVEAQSATDLGQLDDVLSTMLAVCDEEVEAAPRPTAAHEALAAVEPVLC